MIKYVPEDTSVCFAEIPDEICLCFNLSLCPHYCLGCHSQYLQKDIGVELTTDIIDALMKRHDGITCVLFLGGDNDKSTLTSLAKHISNNYDVLVGWYSGESKLDLNYYGRHFDYIKVGPYIKELGPLNSVTTNQRLYFIRRQNNSVISKDVTFMFQQIPSTH